MNIETKYNVGDIVWLMNGQGVTTTVTTARITAVNFEQDNGNFKGGCITYKYAPKLPYNDSYDESKSGSCNERYLFPTKQALLESL